MHFAARTVGAQINWSPSPRLGASTYELSLGAISKVVGGQESPPNSDVHQRVPIKTHTHGRITLPRWIVRAIQQVVLPGLTGILVGSTIGSDTMCPITVGFTTISSTNWFHDPGSTT